MFFQVQGSGEDKGKNKPYSSSHFSIVIGNLLTINGIRFTATKLRHMFVTGWRDFLEHPSTFKHKQVVEKLEQCAASMMLNSVPVWNTTYDDCPMDRGFFTAMAHWGKFQEFMKQQHLLKASIKPINPSTFDFFGMDT
jgi:hypothetical protein